MYEYVIPKEFNQDDRIGKFTIPQAMILGIGGLLIMVFLAFLNWIVGIVLSIPVLIITAIAMYKKINGIPIYEFVLIYAMYQASPKLLIFRGDNYSNDYVDNHEGIELFEE